MTAEEFGVKEKREEKIDDNRTIVVLQKEEDSKWYPLFFQEEDGNTTELTYELLWYDSFEEAIKKIKEKYKIA